jgi:hypothetical protein
MRKRYVPRLRRGLVGLAVATTFAVSLVFLVSTYLQYYRLTRAFCGGRAEAEYVAGSVRHFVRMPNEGHANERFDVGTEHFEYSRFQIGEGFDGKVPSGSHLYEGVRVRIWHIGGVIVHLEIADES